MPPRALPQDHHRSVLALINLLFGLINFMSHVLHCYGLSSAYNNGLSKRG